MKNKKSVGKILSIILLLAMFLGPLPVVPTVEAKVEYKTLSFSKQLKTENDFAKGEFQKIKMKKRGDGVELEMAGEERGTYITPEIKAPFGATHIGLHWKENSVEESLINVYLRVRGEDGDYGDWIKVEVELEDRPDGKRIEDIFSTLVYAEEKEYAQAMIGFDGESGKKPKLKDFTFTFINAGEASKKTVKKIDLAPRAGAETLGVAKTSVGGQTVNVISREEWGADESLRFKDGVEDWPRSYHGTRKLVIHHTAVKGSNGVTDLQENMETVRAIYNWHAASYPDGQGWGDIGYNALVDAAGNIYEGRYGTHEGSNRQDPTPDQVMVLDVEAGHTAGHNQGSFGVAAMGDFTRFKVPEAQLGGLENVLAYVADERGVNVQGRSDFLRYDGTWRSDLNNLIGHRDATATACPGDKLYEKIQDIKNNIDGLLLHNLSGFDGTLNGNDIEGGKVETGTIDLDWDVFVDSDSQRTVSGYQYLLERVLGTPGVADDSQLWNTAWFFPGDITTETSVQIDTAGLQANSNYVFYVRALDDLGNPFSTTKHLNFETGEIIPIEPPEPDTQAPIVSIISPAEGGQVLGTVTVQAEAEDNIGVTRVDLYINGTLLGSDETFPYEINWDTTKMPDGSATLHAEAFDAANNQGSSSTVNVTINNPDPDIQPPSDPTDLVAIAVSESQIDLSWAVSSDNVDVAGYKIFRDGQEVGTTTLTVYQDKGLLPSTAYTYAVSAFDAAGNGSGLSNSVEVTTLVSTNQAPVVSITSPTDGAEVSGVILINANATDADGQVVKMQVYVDGKWMVTKDKDIMEYNFNTRKVSLGTHTIEVWAEDDKGAIGKTQVSFVRVK